MIARLLKQLNDHASLTRQAETAFFADLDDINRIDMHRIQPIIPDTIRWAVPPNPRFPTHKMWVVSK